MPVAASSPAGTITSSLLAQPDEMKRIGRQPVSCALRIACAQARGVTLDNCGISVVVREGDETTVTTLNAAFHLQGVAA